MIEHIQKTIEDSLLVRYNALFHNYLQTISPQTREQIRKNKELDMMFDLFLDFILDSSQHLEENNKLTAAKKPV